MESPHDQPPRLPQTLHPRSASGPPCPTFLGRSALAARAADKPGAKDTVLVVVQLTGGNDGLNTVIPFKNETYYKLRPTLAIPKDQVKKLNDDLGLHPAMGDSPSSTPTTPRCASCRASAIRTRASRTSARWTSGRRPAPPRTSPTAGSAGRLKAKPAPAFHLAGGNESSPLALTGAPVRVPSVASLDDFKLKTAAASGADGAAQKGVITGVADTIEWRRTACSTSSRARR